MKFYQVTSDQEREVFKSISQAKSYIKHLKEAGEENIYFDRMEICIDSDTILNILNGNGYATSILQLSVD